MAAPTLQDVDVPASYASSSPITMPSMTIAADDILVIVIEGASGSYAATGFTEKTTFSTGSSTGALLYKRAVGTETTINVTFSGAWCNGFWFAVRGCITSGDPFDVVATTATGTGTSVSLNAATTTVADTFVVAFSHGADGYDASSGYPPSGYTGIINAASGAGTATYKTQASAGTTGTTGWTLSGSETAWHGTIFALKPPAAAAASSPPLFLPSRSNRALLRR